MDILKTEHNSWFVEPYWFRPHEVLEVSEIKPASIKDCKDWNEEIDWLNEGMTEEESK